MFYDIFTGLCEKRGTSPARVRLDLGISQSTMASWKSRNLTPNATTLQKIADYFFVPVGYFLGEDEDQNSYDLLLDFGKTLAIALGKLRLAEQSGKSKEETDRTRKFCLTLTEDMWDYVSGGLLDAQIKCSSNSHSVLFAALDKLNENGKQEAAKRVEELTEIPRYRRQVPDETPGTPTEAHQDAPEPPPPPSEGMDTAAGENPLEGPEKPEDSG